MTRFIYLRVYTIKEGLDGLIPEEVATTAHHCKTLAGVGLRRTGHAEQNRQVLCVGLKNSDRWIQRQKCAW